MSDSQRGQRRVTEEEVESLLGKGMRLNAASLEVMHVSQGSGASVDQGDSCRPLPARPSAKALHDPLWPEAAKPALPLSHTVDGGFKYRMLFLLALVVMYCLRLFFWPQTAMGHFAPDTQAEVMHYFQLRVGFVLLIALGYLASYLQNWQFERVSLLYVGIGATALVMDYFNAYVHISPEASVGASVLIVLRFMAVFCLLMNAMNARFAPPMPRRLWS